MLLWGSFEINSKWVSSLGIKHLGLKISIFKHFQLFSWRLDFFDHPYFSGLLWAHTIVPFITCVIHRHKKDNILSKTSQSNPKLPFPSAAAIPYFSICISHSLWKYIFCNFPIRGTYLAVIKTLLKCASYNSFFLEPLLPGFNSNKGFIFISAFYFTAFFLHILSLFLQRRFFLVLSKVWETQKPIWKVWENMPSLWPVILDEKLPPPHIQKRIKMASSAFWYWKSQRQARPPFSRITHV